MKYSLILCLEGALHPKSSFSTFLIRGANFLDLKYNLIIYSVIFGMIITSTESCFGKIVRNRSKALHFLHCFQKIINIQQFHNYDYDLPPHLNSVNQTIRLRKNMNLGKCLWKSSSLNHRWLNIKSVIFFSSLS